MPSIASLLNHYGPWAVFALVALESAGVPLPGETILIAASVLAGHSHEGSILLIVALAAAGAILGDNAGFWLGREFGLGLLVRYGGRIGLDEDRLRLGQYLFLRHGGAIVFFGRFAAVLRAYAAALAGANKLAPLKFFVFNAAGGIVWASIFGLGGYCLGDNFHRIAGPFGLLALAGALAAGVFVLASWRRREAELIAQARAALPGPIGLSSESSR